MGAGLSVAGAHPGGPHSAAGPHDEGQEHSGSSRLPLPSEAELHLFCHSCGTRVVYSEEIAAQTCCQVCGESAANLEVMPFEVHRPAASGGGAGFNTIPGGAGYSYDAGPAIEFVTVELDEVDPETGHMHLRVLPHVKGLWERFESLQENAAAGGVVQVARRGGAAAAPGAAGSSTARPQTANVLNEPEAAEASAVQDQEVEARNAGRMSASLSVQGESHAAQGNRHASGREQGREREVRNARVHQEPADVQAALDHIAREQGRSNDEEHDHDDDDDAPADEDVETELDQHQPHFIPTAQKLLESIFPVPYRGRKYVYSLFGQKPARKDGAQSSTSEAFSSASEVEPTTDGAVAAQNQRPRGRGAATQLSSMGASRSVASGSGGSRFGRFLADAMNSATSSTGAPEQAQGPAGVQPPRPSATSGSSEADGTVRSSSSLTANADISGGATVATTMNTSSSSSTTKHLMIHRFRSQGPSGQSQAGTASAAGGIGGDNNSSITLGGRAGGGTSRSRGGAGAGRRSVVESTVVSTWEEECAICKLNFEKYEEVVGLPCAHVFHYDCCKDWLSRQHTCPMCRFELEVDDDKFLRSVGRHVEAALLEEEKHWFSALAKKGDPVHFGLSCSVCRVAPLFGKNAKRCRTCFHSGRTQHYVCGKCSEAGRSVRGHPSSHVFENFDGFAGVRDKEALPVITLMPSGELYEGGATSLSASGPFGGQEGQDYSEEQIYCRPVPPERGAAEPSSSAARDVKSPAPPPRVDDVANTLEQDLERTLGKFAKTASAIGGDERGHLRTASTTTGAATSSSMNQSSMASPSSSSAPSPLQNEALRSLSHSRELLPAADSEAGRSFPTSANGPRLPSSGVQPDAAEISPRCNPATSASSSSAAAATQLQLSASMVAARSVMHVPMGDGDTFETLEQPGVFALRGGSSHHPKGPHVPGSSSMASSGVVTKDLLGEDDPELKSPHKADRILASARQYREREIAPVTVSGSEDAQHKNLWPAAGTSSPPYTTNATKKRSTPSTASRSAFASGAASSSTKHKKFLPTAAPVAQPFSTVPGTIARGSPFAAARARNGSTQQQVARVESFSSPGMFVTSAPGASLFPLASGTGAASSSSSSFGRQGEQYRAGRPSTAAVPGRHQRPLAHGSVDFYESSNLVRPSTSGRMVDVTATTVQPDAPVYGEDHELRAFKCPHTGPHLGLQLKEPPELSFHHGCIRANAEFASALTGDVLSAHYDTVYSNLLYQDLAQREWAQRLEKMSQQGGGAGFDSVNLYASYGGGVAGSSSRAGGGGTSSTRGRGAGLIRSDLEEDESDDDGYDNPRSRAISGNHEGAQPFGMLQSNATIGIETTESENEPMPSGVAGAQFERPPAGSVQLQDGSLLRHPSAPTATGAGISGPGVATTSSSASDLGAAPACTGVKMKVLASSSQAPRPAIDAPQAFPAIQGSTGASSAHFAQAELQEPGESARIGPDRILQPPPDSRRSSVASGRSHAGLEERPRNHDALLATSSGRETSASSHMFITTGGGGRRRRFDYENVVVKRALASASFEALPLVRHALGGSNAFGPPIPAAIASPSVGELQNKARAERKLYQKREWDLMDGHGWDRNWMRRQREKKWEEKRFGDVVAVPPRPATVATTGTTRSSASRTSVGETSTTAAGKHVVPHHAFLEPERSARAQLQRSAVVRGTSRSSNGKKKEARAAEVNASQRTCGGASTNRRNHHPVGGPLTSHANSNRVSGQAINAPRSSYQGVELYVNKIGSMDAYDGHRDLNPMANPLAYMSLQRRRSDERADSSPRPSVLTGFGRGLFGQSGLVNT